MTVCLRIVDLCVCLRRSVWKIFNEKQRVTDEVPKYNYKTNTIIKITRVPVSGDADNQT